MFDQQNFRKFRKCYALTMPLTVDPHIHTHNTPLVCAPAKESVLYPAGSCEKVLENGRDIMEVVFKRIILLQYAPDGLDFRARQGDLPRGYYYNAS